MDRITKDRRSAVMSTVRRSGTRLEAVFAQALDERGLTGFDEQPVGIPGKPDFAHRSARLVVFIDSCFWHGCPQHLRRPASNTEYWQQKIQRNRARDRQVTEELKRGGWRVVRIWEHSVRNPRAMKWWLTRLKHLLGPEAEKRLDSAQGAPKPL
jgi:DNA mismatch endonuclease, patch repair protein